MEIDGDKAVTETASCSDTVGFKVGIQTDLKVGVPILGNGWMHVSAEASYKLREGGVESSTVTWSWKQPLTALSCAFRIYTEAMPVVRSGFRMGRLDHVHIRVPDRAEATQWYAKHLGFEPVDAYDFWATGFEGGPLQISADGGRTTLALFEASEDHPMVPQKTGVAFSVDADSFMSFAQSLPCGIENPRGELLAPTDLVDFDLCWALDLVDPWGNQYELNCYEYDRVRVELVEADAVAVIRYWPRQLYVAYSAAGSS